MHQVVDPKGVGVQVASYLTPKELYNYILLNKENYESSVLQTQFHTIMQNYIEKGLEFIKIAQPIKEFKLFLEELPYIPTELITYAYNLGSKEILVELFLPNFNDMIGCSI